MPSRAVTRSFFNGFSRDLSNGLHNFSSAVIKAKLVTALPTVATATNAVLTEVTGANYTAGGIDLSVSVGGVLPQTLIESAIDTLWAENPAGFTNAVAVVVHNETSGRMISFGDITVDAGTTPVSSAVQDVDVNWANGTEICKIG